MSNLGLYQQITTAAKAAGGVEQLIKHIEFDAVKKAAPALVGVGVLIGAGAKPALDASKRGLARLKGSGAAAAEAKERLRAIVDESTSSGDVAEGPVGDPYDTCDGIPEGK
ncbi:hypothetical protein [Pseudarthrobacter niigatensis]|uniref:Uncharacterized protein n=1 Tax=Pseudarthrobacter niigatensis TaxID=369935 RepID=A0AAJ1WEK9_9MICC|nr:hypothetical protein [Pseudarthrobacter niigatensis]MDQ0144720.1 hypothetical protein [Pseudarthrobacter niigatensis]MDQ0265366.1 hypothetical protein [Pseudarthrobacter niigatensis]